jgi:glycosyltransferase involved in cell wall biosynthesis
MKRASEPPVSIVTPVHNDVEYLRECIESVRAQTYGNWNYTIVDNVSSDGSLEIARSYAVKDSRIRVVESDRLLPALRNHNRALRLASARGEYCKMVFADDWLFPECVERMVAVAEANPTVGIVGAYGLEGVRVVWTGLPYTAQVVSGREVCRSWFLDDVYVFGTATSLLYRAESVRQHDPFYNETNVHADVESCLAVLKTWDFGFVHQVLSYTRVRPHSRIVISRDRNTLIASKLNDLVIYGPDSLTVGELKVCMDRLVREYYDYLGGAVLGGRDPEFWAYHKKRIEEAGVGFKRMRLARAAAKRLLRAILDPIDTIGSVRKRGGISTICPWLPISRGWARTPRIAESAEADAL